MIQLAYIVAAVCFILSLKGLSSPATARRGNLYGVAGMAIAIAATLATPGLDAWLRLAAAGLAGGALGALLATRVPMTAMPEMVALLHSFVGAAATLVGLSAWHHGIHAGAVAQVEIFLGVAIGAPTFTGSVVAFLKLKGTLSGKPLLLPGRHALNLTMILALVALCVWFVAAPSALPLYLGGIVAGLLGAHVILAIGGADMPVIVSVLNSASGWAAAATGFVLGNDLLIITGALVGASGAILSIIMSRGMNRSIGSVLMGGFGDGDGDAAAAPGSAAAEAIARGVNVGDVETAVELMRGARNVVVVPGYGLAVAQAQHPTWQLVQRLEAEGVRVRFAIHPVAGRLPGHMNVLLAEADVPYEIVLEMDEINPDLPETDVVLVLGANDIVNPDALDKPGSPIYGMPILEVFRARTVIVVKRSMRPGFSGIDNPLYNRENTMMVFGDAREVVEEMVRQLKGAPAHA
ncbi:MAG TPA: NAD(P)(+) transhydrogenase (Re/Si-specific) subunit beta [Gemmatimonadota bacterium]|nr:NAD(P)(+) transhydrogenase (Re/Si-specific) subunit beta [Gemmatimonadota bacterium]